MLDAEQIAHSIFTSVISISFHVLDGPLEELSHGRRVFTIMKQRATLVVASKTIELILLLRVISD